jgi:hypothetical protein
MQSRGLYLGNAGERVLAEVIWEKMFEKWEETGGKKG